MARVPRPVIDTGSVLVRVRFSLISTGTELSGLRASGQASDKAGVAARARASAGLARHYLRAAIAEPDRAARRAIAIARSRLAVLKPTTADVPRFTLAELNWARHAATTMERSADRLRITTDVSGGAYQATAGPIDVDSGLIPVISVRGIVERGAVTMGILNETQDRWLGSRVYEAGAFDDQLIFDAAGSKHVTFVVATAGAPSASSLVIERLTVTMTPPTSNGLPQSELEQQGWNVGYSAAGEVIEVGEGVSDIAPGDLVACGGAGIANHADFVNVPRNLVCLIPEGCSVDVAATTTVGAIALQGVRRAGPELGERIAVLGLGLIGQITVQLLRAAGVRVYGLDLDARRVDRAMGHGLSGGASDPVAFERLIRNATNGRGADRAIVTAASKTSHAINLAMEVTRAKGTVVIVGDVGLHVERAQFYRKEIDLLMSTSYGPGRYDARYEQGGIDYPFAHVRWTLNRNMQAYMETVADGKLDIRALIDRVVGIDQAPQAYRDLASSEDAPLAVLLRFPDDERPLPEPSDATSVHIRGHRRPAVGVVQFALVGAGAFGTSMLVPQMQKRRDVFFLRAIVSRTTVQASNFARANQVEVLASDLAEVLRDPDIALAVIATRHDQHAREVIACLQAGKHVFVEKPLALSWDELDRVIETWEGLQESRILTVGFNRRFSPAVDALAQALSGRQAPIMMTYRVNAGYIPLDHWVQSQHGGGRNIGEACHMYDTMRFIAGAPVAAIAAVAIRPGNRPLLRTDNFTASLRYADGSVGNLVYTASGPKGGLAKERIEVFCDGEAYVLDDFVRLTRASDAKVLWESSTPDKGHEREMSRLADALRDGSAAPIPTEELFETTATSLYVEDLLFERAADQS